MAESEKTDFSYPLYSLYPLRIPAVGVAMLLALAVTVAGGEAWARSQAIYTVANFPIDAVARDAVAAKRQALADGDLRAFRSLLKRLVPVTAYGRLPHLDLKRVRDLIKGFRVRGERNSATEYLATLDYTFKPQAVRALLRSYSLPYIETQAPAVVIVPVYRSGSGEPKSAETGGPPPSPSAALRKPGRVWRKAGRVWREVWKGLDLVHALTPVKLRPAKSRLTAEVMSGVLDGDESMLRLLADIYGSERVVLALAKPAAGGTKLDVTLVGADAVGGLRFARTWRIYDADLAYAAELAAVVGLGVIEGRWKAVQARAKGILGPGTGAASEPVLFTVLFKGLGAWQSIRRRLVEMPGVEKLDVGALSARGAEVTLGYPGGAAAFARALKAEGLTLAEEGSTLVLRVGGG